MTEVKVVNEEAGEVKVYKAEGLFEVDECSGSMMSDAEEVVAVDADSDDDDDPEVTDSG